MEFYNYGLDIFTVSYTQLKMPTSIKLTFCILGHVFFGVLMILSVLYFKERIIHLDAAFYITKIINEELPNISGRYSAVFSQILPWLAVKAGWPLKTVLLTYSFSFILLFYLVYLICVYKLKNIFAGLAIVLVLCLCTRNSFYYAVTEMHQGLVFSVLFFATLSYSRFNYKTKSLPEFLMLSLIIIICYYLHPTTFFLILFSILFVAVDRKMYTNKYLILLIIFTSVLFLSKIGLTPATGPEGKEFSQIKNYSAHLSGFFELPVILFLKGHSGSFTIIYVYAEILLGVLFTYYICHRKFLKILVISVFILLFVFFNAIVYANGESGIVLEKSLLPLSFFVAIPFATDFLVKTRINHWVIFGLFLALIFLRVRDITQTAKSHQKRTHYTMELCEATRKYQGRKFLLEKRNISEKIKVSWAFACETLLFSSLAHPDSARTIYVLDQKNISEVDTGAGNFLFTPFWQNKDVDWLNKNYFNLPDQRYVFIKEDCSRVGNQTEKSNRK